MKRIPISRSYHIFLSSMLLFPITPMQSAVESDGMQHASQEQEVIYIRLDKAASNIAEVVAQLSALDSDVNSPLRLLQKHLEDGFIVGLHDEIVQVLEYADWFVDQQPKNDATKAIAIKLDAVIAQVLDGALDISEDAIMRDSNLNLRRINARIAVLGKALFQSNVVVKKKLRVHGDARFYEDVIMQEKLRVHGDARFY